MKARSSEKMIPTVYYPFGGIQEKTVAVDTYRSEKLLAKRGYNSED